MKNTLSLISILLMLSILTLMIVTSCQSTTVLEISVHRGAIEGFYRVNYSEKKILSTKANYIDFKSILGVENYLNEVADFDLSQWR